MQEKDILKTELLPTDDAIGDDALKVSLATRQELGTLLKERLKTIKQMQERSDWEDMKADALRDYHMLDKDNPKPWEGAADLPCPLPRIFTDSYHANVMQSLFPNGHLVVKPGSFVKNFLTTAKRGAEYLSYQTNYESNLYSVIDDVDSKVQKFGVGYAEPYWSRKVSYQTVKITETTDEPVVDQATGTVSLQEKKVTRTKKEKKTHFDGIKVDSLPVDSVYKSPFIRTLNEAVENDVVFKTFKLTWDKIKARSVVPKSADKDQKDPFYLKDAVDDLRIYEGAKFYDAQSKLDEARKDYDGFDVMLDNQLSKTELDLAEAYLWYDIDNDDLPENVKVTFHVVSGTVLRVSLSKCRIVEFIARPVDERGGGEGIPTICKPFTREWEAIHNHRVNAGQIENTPFGFYHAGGRLNPATLPFVPGRFYPVDNPNEINYAQTPTVRSSFFNEEQLLLGYAERVFAASENFQGVNSQRQTTATESINQSQKSAVRFANPFQRIVMAMSELLTHMWELNNECSPDEKEFYVVGPGDTPLFDNIHKSDFAVQLQWRPDVQTVFDQQMLRDTVLLKYRMFISNPLVVQNPAVLYDLTTMTDEAVGGQTLSIPKPEQSKTRSPMEEIEMMNAGKKDIEPVLGEDVDQHLMVHDAFIHTDAFKDLEQDVQMQHLLHRDKTKVLKQTLESANLNQSGLFQPPQGGLPEQPGMTATRNPSQSFNTMRIGEGSRSAENNAAINGPGINQR